MLNLETSVQEGTKAENILQDLNLQKIYDLQVERIAGNCWILVTTDDRDEESLANEITNDLIRSGLREFEITTA